MKRRILTIIITLLLVLAIPLTLLGWGFGLPARYGETFMGELKHKVRLLQNTPGRRIVLVGGSSVAFGIDSALLEAHFPDYQVVNFGMYAALGTTVMLDLSQDLIRQGDIVILMPEQQAQTLSDWFDPAVMWQGVDGAFWLLQSLTPEQQAMMLSSFPQFAGDKFALALQGEILKPEGVYRRDSFNAYGDIATPLCTQNVMAGGYDANTPIRFDPGIVSEAFLARVNAYASALTDKGAVLWYGFCPMNAAAVSGDPDAFYDALQGRLTFPILGDPNDSILESGWFYDTNFHLNASGRTVFTQSLIRSIKAMLGDSSPTRIALPAMPDPAGAVLWTGDNSHQSYFLYEVSGNTVTIVGVTDSGKTQPSLTVPSTWNDLAVTAIDAQAFSGCDSLCIVTIQQNVRSIADGAFSGCHQLEQIVVTADTPAGCTVGAGLLEGTDANIYVNSTVLSAYRTDYFWSVHARRILPLES